MMSSETHWGSDSANVGLGDDCPEPTYAELEAELEKYVLLESGAVAFEIQMQSRLQDLTQQNQRLKGVEVLSQKVVDAPKSSGFFLVTEAINNLAAELKKR